MLFFCQIEKVMRIKRFLLLLLLSPLLVSCIYKMDIRQGNLVTPDMRDKLKIGMTKAQVRYVMGTPMINDPFHDNRWDYYYRLEQDGKLTEHQGMTLFFEGDSLTRIVDSDPGNVPPPAGVQPTTTDGQGAGHEQN